MKSEKQSQMQQRVKDVFSIETKQEDMFVQELYKLVRNKAKKIDKQYQKQLSDEESQKLEQQKQILEEQLQTFELYKKYHYSQSQNSEQNQKENKIQYQEVQLSSVTKVVDDQIIINKEKVKTSNKEIQSVQPMKLLVKDTNQIEEALKLTSQMIHIGQNLTSILLNSNMNIQQRSLLTNEEMLLIHSFFFDITVGSMNVTQESLVQQTFANKIQYTTKELLKLYQADLSAKVTCQEKFTYGQLKQCLDKIYNNTGVLNSKLIPLTQLQQNSSIDASNQQNESKYSEQKEVSDSKSNHIEDLDEQADQDQEEEQQEEVKIQKVLSSGKKRSQNDNYMNQDWNEVDEDSQENEEDQMEEEQQQEDQQEEEEEQQEEEKDEYDVQEYQQERKQFGKYPQYRQQQPRYNNRGSYYNQQRFVVQRANKRGGEYQDRGQQQYRNYNKYTYARAEYSNYRPRPDYNRGRGRGSYRGRTPFYRNNDNDQNYNYQHKTYKQYDYEQEYQDSYQDSYKESSEQQQDLKEDGFEVVKARSKNKEVTQQPYSQSKGPRQAQGAIRGRGQTYYKDYRGTSNRNY